ncbi:hypothetical protein CJF31_00009366 [Rutstroemia sp. NJR-2017a BVV2]|nr:hypothetical protein CJF31_00009366 [Rutstroemia sp. NJR-2017a BVV2]
MPTNFLSLPSELRNDIYEQVLTGFSNNIEESMCEDDDQESQIPGLLLANKRIYLEASSVLYAATTFDLSIYRMPEVVKFLERIGRRNASFILNIRIDFPYLKDLRIARVTFEDESEAALAAIRDYCTSLRTLTAVRESVSTMEETLLVHNQYRKGYEMPMMALQLADERFRAVASLQEIIIELDEGIPPTYLRTEMKRRGWRIVEFEEHVPGFPSPDEDEE